MSFLIKIFMGFFNRLHSMHATSRSSVNNQFMVILLTRSIPTTKSKFVMEILLILPYHPWIHYVSEKWQNCRCKEEKWEKDIWHRRFIAGAVKIFPSKIYLYFLRLHPRYQIKKRRRRRNGRNDGKLVYKIKWKS